MGLSAVHRVLGCIPEREKRGAADAAGCVEGLCSLALRGRKFGCPLPAGGWTVFFIRKGASRGGVSLFWEIFAKALKNMIIFT